jgi:tetratricopeptide (TPR) repeat protein
LLQLGDFREMERSISDAKKLKPRSPLPFLIQGRVGHLEALESAKALGPTDPWIRFTLGWTHLIQGNVTDAEKELTVGLRRARWCKWAYILRARARLRRGDVDAARQDLESALTIDPDIHATHRSWSTIDGDPEEILELNYAIHSNPNAGWLLAWRGLIYFNLLLPDQALDDFRRAVNLEPNCGWARAFLARAESLWLTTGKSITELRTAYISSPQCRWILLWQGYFNAKRGDYKAAAKNYNSVLKSHPHYALAYGWSAKLRAEMGDLTGGLLQIDLAVELDPTYGFHFERRRRILWSLDKPDAAFHDMVLAVRREGRFRWSGGQKREEDLNSHLQLDKHLRIYPHDDWALAWRGDTRLAMGNLSGALNDLNSAIALSPNEPWRRAWRGDVKLHLRDYQGALDDAELSLKGDPQYSRAWGVRARALISVHKFKEAISSLNHVINNDFGAAWAFHERAKILMQQRRYGEAIHDLQRTIALDKNNDKARKDILAAKKMSKFMAS